MLQQETAERGDEFRLIGRLKVHRSAIRSARVPLPRTFVGEGSVMLAVFRLLQDPEFREEKQRTLHLH